MIKFNRPKLGIGVYKLIEVFACPYRGIYPQTTLKVQKSFAQDVGELCNSKITTIQSLQYMLWYRDIIFIVVLSYQVNLVTLRNIFIQALETFLA